MSLRPKMVLMLLPPLLAVIVALVLFSQSQMHEMAMDEAYAEAESILMQEARSFAESSNKAYATAQTLALQMAELKKTGEVSRDVLSAMLRAQMAANKDYFGIWNMWEPDAFDGKDKDTPQSDYATETGAINIYWAWGENGELEAVPGDDAMREDDYYALPKKTRGVIFPPVYFDDSVKKYINSVSVPILVDNTFVGAIGVDQALDDIMARIAAIRPYETGYAMIFDKDGTVIAAPDPALIGKPLPEGTPKAEREAITGQKTLRTSGKSPYTGEEVLTVYRHIPVADGKNSWCFSVSVPMDSILAKSTTTVRIMLAVGLVGLLAMSGLIIFVISRMVNALKQGVEYARIVAEGNLEADYTTDRKDEIGVLAVAVSSMVRRMRESLAHAAVLTQEAEAATVKAEKALQAEAERAKAEEAQRQGMLAVAVDLEHIVAKLGDAASALAVQVQQAVAGTKHTLDQAETSSSAAQNLDSAASQMAVNASKAAEFAEMAREEAGKGTRSMGEVVNAVSEVSATSAKLKEHMAGLGSDVDAISGTMGVISDIADQTNLLALNAAIEAARAGDSGRGFAVVAGEVRKLAERTMQATGEVARVVANIQNGTRLTMEEMERTMALVDNSTKLAGETGRALSEIEALVRKSAEQVETITDASREQTQLSDMITQSAKTVKDIAGDTASAMQTSSGTVQELTVTAKRLAELTSLLRVPSK